MTFPYGKHKVITLSYDDGRTADKTLVRILNHYGLKSTFHINGGLLDTADRIPAPEVAKLYKGHEISSHTFTHPTIARCSDGKIIEEIIEDRKVLEEMTGYPVRGLSYPNGSFDERIKRILPSIGIEYARTVHSTGAFDMPDDLYQWNPTCHHKHDLINLSSSFFDLHKTQYLYMLYIWGHSYEFDNDGNWDLIEQFCERAAKRDDIWYATNIEIVDYLAAFHHLKFSASSKFVYNPSILTVWLKVDNSIIEVTGGSQVEL